LLPAATFIIYQRPKVSLQKSIRRYGNRGRSARLLSMRDEAIDHLSVLVKQVVHQNRAILEGISSLPTRDDLHRLEDKIDGLDKRMTVVEEAVKDVSRELAAHIGDHNHRSGPVRFRGPVPRPI